MSKIEALDFGNYVQTETVNLKNILTSKVPMSGTTLKDLVEDVAIAIPSPSTPPAPDPQAPTADPELEYLKTFYASDPDRQTYNSCIYYLIEPNTVNDNENIWMFGGGFNCSARNFTLKCEDFSLLSSSGCMLKTTDSGVKTSIINGKEYFFVRQYLNQEREPLESWETAYSDGYPAVSTNIVEICYTGNNPCYTVGKYLLVNGVINNHLYINSNYEKGMCKFKQIYFSANSMLVSPTNSYSLSMLGDNGYLDCDYIESEDDIIKGALWKTSGTNASVTCGCSAGNNKAIKPKIPSKYYMFGIYTIGGSSYFPSAGMYITNNELTLRVISSRQSVTTMPFNIVTANVNNNITVNCVFNTNPNSLFSTNNKVFRVKKLSIHHIQNSASQSLSGTNELLIQHSLKVLEIKQLAVLDTNATFGQFSNSLEYLLLPRGFSCKTLTLQSDIFFTMKGLLYLLNSLSSTTSYSGSRTLMLAYNVKNNALNYYVKLDGDQYIEAEQGEVGAISIIEAFTAKNWTVS